MIGVFFCRIRYQIEQGIKVRDSRIYMNSISIFARTIFNKNLDASMKRPIQLDEMFRTVFAGFILGYLSAVFLCAIEIACPSFNHMLLQHYITNLYV